MKSLDFILQNYKSETIDGRDLYRLAEFIPFEKIPLTTLQVKEGTTAEAWNANTKEFTRENILAQLERDVAFGFEKALNQRGISSSLMANVVMMWNWILEEGLEDFDDYAQYGLPLFKATAVKYGWNNPIGEDSGSEYKYSSH